MQKKPLYPVRFESDSDELFESKVNNYYARLRQYESWRKKHGEAEIERHKTCLKSRIQSVIEERAEAHSAYIEKDKRLLKKYLDLVSEFEDWD